MSSELDSLLPGGGAEPVATPGDLAACGSFTASTRRHAPRGKQHGSKRGAATRRVRAREASNDSSGPPLSSAAAHGAAGGVDPETYDADFEEEDDDAGISADNASHASGATDHARDWLQTATSIEVTCSDTTAPEGFEPPAGASSKAAAAAATGGSAAALKRRKKHGHDKTAAAAAALGAGDGDGNGGAAAFDTTIRGVPRLGPRIEGGGGVCSGDELPQVSPRTQNLLQSPPPSARSVGGAGSGYESTPALPALPNSARGSSITASAGAPVASINSSRDASTAGDHLSLPSLPLRSRGGTAGALGGTLSSLGAFEVVDIGLPSSSSTTAAAAAAVAPRSEKQPPRHMRQ